MGLEAVTGSLLHGTCRPPGSRHRGGVPTSALAHANFPAVARARLGIVPGLVLAAALLAACSSAPATSSSSIGDPTAVLRGVPAAAQHAGSVHVVEYTTSKGFSSTLTGELNASSLDDAEEHLVQGKSEFDVERVGGDVYLRGQASVIGSILDFSTEQADAYAGKWIELTPGDYLYPKVSDTLDLAAEVKAFIPVGSDLEALPERTLRHVTVVPITGAPSSSVAQGASGSMTLFVNPATPHLPSAATLVLHDGKESVSRLVAFTHWGQPISLSRPPGAVLYRVIATTPVSG